MLFSKYTFLLSHISIDLNCFYFARPYLFYIGMTVTLTCPINLSQYFHSAVELHLTYALKVDPDKKSSSPVLHPFKALCIMHQLLPHRCIQDARDFYIKLLLASFGYSLGRRVNKIITCYIWNIPAGWIFVFIMVFCLNNTSKVFMYTVF